MTRILLVAVAVISFQPGFMFKFYQDDVFCGMQCFWESLRAGLWGPVWILAVIAAACWLRSSIFWLGTAEIVVGPLASRLVGDIIEPIARIVGWPGSRETMLRRLDMLSQMNFWPGISLIALGMLLSFFDIGWLFREGDVGKIKASLRRALGMLALTILLLVIVPMTANAISRYLYVHWIPWK